MKKDLTFSQKIAKLTEIIKKLEAGDLELEEVEKLVLEGTKLLEDAKDQLENLEGKIIKITKKPE